MSHTREPWLVGVEATLRPRQGVMIITLMTDEAGAQMLAAGQVPDYIKDQCAGALEWCATDERGYVRALSST